MPREVDFFDGMDGVDFTRRVERTGRTYSSNAIPGSMRTHQAGNLLGKTRQVIVAQSGGGDFKDIHDAIAHVDMAGGGTVFIKNGTYDEREDINIPSGVNLFGESVGGVVINFGASRASVKAEGTDLYSTGTVSITKGSNVVTGSGTTWSSNLTEGHYIKIGKYIYEIANVVSDTSIELTTKVFDKSNASLTYFAGNFVRNIQLQNIVIAAPLVSGLVMNHVDGFYMQNIIVSTAITGSAYDLDVVSRGAFNLCSADGSGGNGMTIDDITQVNFAFFVSTNNGNRGIEINDTSHCGFEYATLNNNAATGFMATNINRVALRTSDVANNGNHGVELATGCNYNQIYTGAFEDNVNDGIVLTEEDDNNSIFGIVATNNGNDGVNIADATDNDNIVTNCQLAGNTGSSLTDNGTSTTSANNET